MNFVEPRTEILSVTYEGETYSTEYYKTATLISGIVDDVYPVWSAEPTTAHTAGDYVIVPELKKIYRYSATATTNPFPPADKSSWIDYGPINSMKMFATDEHIGSQTIGTDIVMEFDFSRADVFSCVDIEFTHVTVELTNNDNATTSEPIIINGYEIGTYDIAELFYTDKKIKTSFIASGLEWMPNSTLKLTFSGDVKIGTSLYGNNESLFVTLWGSSLEYASESKFLVSEITGWRTVLRYGKVKVLVAEVIYETNDYDLIAKRIDEILDRNMLWIPMPKDRFTSSIIIGYIEKAKLPMRKDLAVQTSMKIIGVNKK